ncbi:hypothetical protein H7170_04010 [Candidatus Gracilibacteria bacterium]|nr:hypothetical protein [Candidatus Gracilibacteria bacterium]
MATGMPGQLEFDFTPQRGDIRVGVTPVSKSISQKTEQVLSGGVHQKSRYIREETLQI